MVLGKKNRTYHRQCPSVSLECRVSCGNVFGNGNCRSDQSPFKWVFLPVSDSLDALCLLPAKSTRHRNRHYPFRLWNQQERGRATHLQWLSGARHADCHSFR